MGADEKRRGGPDRLERVLRLLDEELRARLAHHPQGHLLAGGREELDLGLSLPPGASAGRLAEEAERLDAEIARALEGALAHRAAFRPGRVFCLRCGGADCEHSLPAGPREVFSGYGPSGLPRFLDLGQLLLERGDPRVDRLFGDPATLLAHTVPGPELVHDLIEAFEDRATGFRVHGQVTAGWYRVPDPETRRPATLALTLQTVSTKPEGRRRRFALNVVGRGPDGQPLEQLFDRMGDLPWLEAVRWAQGELDRLSRGRRARKGKGAVHAEEPPERRLRGILDGLARRIERPRRADQRRTRHARTRHAEGDRPTAQALADLARAGGEQLLVDTRRETLVVLGAKGRAHLFSPGGKHVTSIRFEPGAIERRRDRRRWRPASPDEIEALRAAVRGRSGGELFQPSSPRE